MVIQGRGGTDFRPVFQFVREKQRKKELENLRALIYFTDGDGIYPRQKPDYETAFCIPGTFRENEIGSGLGTLPDYRAE